VRMRVNAIVGVGVSVGTPVASNTANTINTTAVGLDVICVVAWGVVVDDGGGGGGGGVNGKVAVRLGVQMCVNAIERR